MTRLFVAVDLPDTVKTQLSALCSGVPNAKWVKRDQMHVTLRFIGEADDTTFAAIKSGLATIQSPAFEMKMEGVGQFPPKGAPRVLWAGIHAPEELGQLQTQVEATMAKLGLGAADHPFSPHMTLARLKMKPERGATERFITEHKEFHTTFFKVSNFILYSSVLAQNGAIYHAEGVYALHTN